MKTIKLAVLVAATLGTAGRAAADTDVRDADERAGVIAHELGHAFGLVHVAVAERAPVASPGNVTVEPTDADVATLRSLWGACAAQ